MPRIEKADTNSEYRRITPIGKITWGKKGDIETFVWLKMLQMATHNIRVVISLGKENE